MLKIAAIGLGASAGALASVLVLPRRPTARPSSIWCRPWPAAARC
ncbi:hypothetical protein [Teichococcus aestuarii]